MNYRDRYVTVDLDDEEFNAISTFLAQQKNFEQTEIEGVRTCDVCFVDDPDLNEVVRQWVTKVNEAALWDFNIDYLEPLQLTRYKEGDKYDWHQDESEWHKDKREEGLLFESKKGRVFLEQAKAKKKKQFSSERLGRNLRKN